jgi:hypothetical protein
MVFSPQFINYFEYSSLPLERILYFDERTISILTNAIHRGRRILKLCKQKSNYVKGLIRIYVDREAIKNVSTFYLSNEVSAKGRLNELPYGFTYNLSYFLKGNQFRLMATVTQKNIRKKS